MKRLAIWVTLFLSMPGPGHAQELSLTGGTWIHSEDDPDINHPGYTMHFTMIAEFRPDQRLVFRTALANQFASAEYITTYNFEITGASSYAATAIDYMPKQTCGGGICAPQPPMIPMGTRATCEFEFNGALFVSISCDGGPAISYSRH